MLGIVIPVWKRPELTRRVLLHWGSTRFDFAHKVVVLSPEDPSNHIIPNGFDVVWASNEDRQRKWQAGLDVMPDSVDAVMMMGSDDIATEPLIRTIYERTLEHGMAYPGSIYFAHAPTKRCFHAFYRVVYAGCAYRRDLIDAAGVPLFVRPEAKEMAPDVASLYNMRRNWHKPGYRVPNCAEDRIIVDIKTETNVWSYDDMFARSARKATTLDALDYDALFNNHFGGFWDG